MRALSSAAFMLWASATLSVSATEQSPVNNAALEARLKTFDPRAVAAARHYYSLPSVKSGLIAMQSAVNDGIKTAVLKQRPDLTSEQVDRFVESTGQVAVERYDLFLKMGMVAQLETLSTEEIVAVDRFYSSPEGSAILAKMPQMSARLMTMVQAMAPGILNDVRSRMKTDGTEPKP